MNASQAYIAISIGVLLLIALFIFFTGRKETERGLNPLAGLAFGFVLAGILFGEERLIGYSLLGIGVVLALIDIFIRLKRRPNQ